MVIILVHWQVITGREKRFIRIWKKMTLSNRARFYREILTRVIKSKKDHLNTFTLADPNYSTFINVGIWESANAFDKAVGRFIPKPKIVYNKKKKRKMKRIELELVEYKLRERVVLKKVLDKEGNLEFPLPDIRRRAG